MSAKEVPHIDLSLDQHVLDKSIQIDPNISGAWTDRGAALTSVNTMKP